MKLQLIANEQHVILCAKFNLTISVKSWQALIGNIDIASHQFIAKIDL